MKTQSIPQHFDHPVDELEFALNGMIQLHEAEILELRNTFINNEDQLKSTIHQLEAQIFSCPNCKNKIQIHSSPSISTTTSQILDQNSSINQETSNNTQIDETEKLDNINLVLDSTVQSNGGLDSDQISVASDLNHIRDNFSDVTFKY